MVGSARLTLDAAQGAAAQVALAVGPLAKSCPVGMAFGASRIDANVAVLVDLVLSCGSDWHCSNLL
jgi:hypothetical protein